MNAAATAQADQYAAATSTVTGGMDTLVLDHGYRPGTTRADPWLLALLADAVSDTCPHVGGMRAPAPVFVSAHRRRVECHACHRSATVAQEGTAEDVTCDRCRTVPADRKLTTGAAAFGPVVVPLGLCDECVPAIHGDAR